VIVGLWSWGRVVVVIWLWGCVGVCVHVCVRVYTCVCVGVKFLRGGGFPLYFLFVCHRRGEDGCFG